MGGFGGKYGAGQNPPEGGVGGDGESIDWLQGAKPSPDVLWFHPKVNWGLDWGPDIGIK